MVGELQGNEKEIDAKSKVVDKTLLYVNHSL